MLNENIGYVGSAALRRELGNLAGRWQALAFTESARVRINRDPWTPAQNRATLSGAGIGLTWEGPVSPTNNVRRNLITFAKKQ